jgi:hypothetical protein
LPEATNGRATHARLEERTVLVGGAPVQRVSLIDPKLGEECTVATAADGKPRCLPVNGLVAQRTDSRGYLHGLSYEDERCTQRLYYQTTDPGDYDPYNHRSECDRKARYARVVEGTPCAPVVRIYNVRPATAVFWIDDTGQCVRVVYPDPDHPAFALVDEVPAATFAQGTAATR